MHKSVQKKKKTNILVYQKYYTDNRKTTILIKIWPVNKTITNQWQYKQNNREVKRK